MWDSPELMNRATSALHTAAFLLVVGGAVHVLVRQPYFDVREIWVVNGGGYVTYQQVRTIVETDLKGTFFTLHLPAVHRSFEKLPWVRTVNLRRRWPAGLEVTVEVHEPLARWGTSALVNTYGEVFHAAYDGRLPVFVGPPGAAKEIAIQYEFFRRNLAAIGAEPVLVQLNERRAWQVKLDNGTTLALGRESIEERLTRYVSLHARTVGALNRRIDYVDLRYANGFAVRIPELKGEQSQRTAPRARRT
jgi:cell division protein FtsQ